MAAPINSELDQRKFRRVYHLHIRKTGGTSLNEWLDDMVPFERAMPPGWDKSLFLWYRDKGIWKGRCHKSVSRACWDFFDIIHAHENFLENRAEHSSVLSVFRDPIARSISLFYDDASLIASDLVRKRPIAIAFHRDCISRPFEEVRRKWHRRGLFLSRYSDPMCAALVSPEISRLAFFRMSPNERFDRALASIDRNIDAFGLTEQMEKTAHHFSQILGLYPKTTLPKFNIGRPHKTEFTEADRRYLESITLADRMLYEALSRRFEKIDVRYSVDDFERHKLAEAMQRVETRKKDGKIIYDMNAALIGDGFWGRDSRGKPDVCRWTGPGDNSVIYIPAAPAPRVKISVEVRGWLCGEARSSFCVRVWGKPVEHTFSPGENLANIATFFGTPRNGILKLEFHIPAKTDDECGHPNSDGRRKGALINRIVIRGVENRPAPGSS